MGTICPIRPLWTEFGTYTMTLMAGFLESKLLQPYNYDFSKILSLLIITNPNDLPLNNYGAATTDPVRFSMNQCQPTCVVDNFSIYEVHTFSALQLTILIIQLLTVPIERFLFKIRMLHLIFDVPRMLDYSALL